jgi:hypothetical protein
MQAQKLDYALLSLLGTVDIEFRTRPTDADRRAVARLGGVCRANDAATLTITAPALSMAPLTDLPTVAKLHYGGVRQGQ